MHLLSLLIAGSQSAECLLMLRLNQVEVFMLKFTDFILIVRVGVDAEHIMGAWLHHVRHRVGWM
jgi:hypothetical protein